MALVETAPLLASLIGIAELRQVVPLMALGVLASNLSEVSMALLRRELRFRALAVAQAVSYVVAYGVVAVAWPCSALACGRSPGRSSCSWP